MNIKKPLQKVKTPNICAPMAKKNGALKRNPFF